MWTPDRVTVSPEWRRFRPGRHRMSHLRSRVQYDVMTRSAVSHLLVWLSGLRSPRRRVRLSAGRIKVNLGSGLSVAPGWINIDASANAAAAACPVVLRRLAFRASGARSQTSQERYLGILAANRFVFHDVRRGLPFPDSSVDCLYASHLLEHLERHEAVALVGEGRRVLRSGGVFRIVVPDLAYYVDLYQRGSREEAVSGIFAAGVQGPLGRHRYMYDEAGLRALADEAGFTEMRRCAFREGRTPDLAILDNRQDESLYVELRR